jgi:hypothetical protein
MPGMNRMKMKGMSEGWKQIEGEVRRSEIGSNETKMRTKTKMKTKEKGDEKTYGCDASLTPDLNDSPFSFRHRL